MASVLKVFVHSRKPSPMMEFSSSNFSMSHQFSSVAQLCPTLCDPMNHSTPGLPVHHQLREFTQTHIHWIGDAILWHPLLLLSIFPSIRVFSNKSVLLIRWSKYWSFSSSISPSNEYSGLISFRMDCSDLLGVRGTLMSLLQHHSSKAWAISFFFLAAPYGMPDLSSPTRDWTLACCSGSTES